LHDTSFEGTVFLVFSKPEFINDFHHAVADIFNVNRGKELVALEWKGDAGLLLDLRGKETHPLLEKATAEDTAFREGIAEDLLKHEGLNVVVFTAHPTGDHDVFYTS